MVTLIQILYVFQSVNPGLNYLSFGKKGFFLPRRQWSLSPVWWLGSDPWSGTAHPQRAHGHLSVSLFLLNHKGGCFSWCFSGCFSGCFSWCFSFHSGEHGEGLGGEGEPVQVCVRHPAAPAQQCHLGREERAEPGDIETPGTLWLPMRGLTPSGRAAGHVDSVNKVHVGKDSVDAVEYPEWFAWKVVLIAQCWELREKMLSRASAVPGNGWGGISREKIACSVWENIRNCLQLQGRVF